MHGKGLSYDYGLWMTVIVNVLFFGFFAVSFLLPKKKREWRSLSVFTAFIVALFVEMYGFPLTIYLLTPLLMGKLGITDPFTHLGGHLWGTLLGLPDWGKMLICQMGSIFMFAGILIMGIGWKKIHDAKGELVTDGIYSYVRHPQYGGIFLVTIGMLIQWPTIATILMWPILILVYKNLAKREERDMEEAFGQRYLEYKKHIPAFIPTFRRSL